MYLRKLGVTFQWLKGYLETVRLGLNIVSARPEIRKQCKLTLLTSIQKRTKTSLNLAQIVKNKPRLKKYRS